MFVWISDPQAWIALATLTRSRSCWAIDNIVFISILSDRLPREQQARARTIGLALAMFGRVGAPALDRVDHAPHHDLFAVLGEGFSGRDLILIAGGLFLIGKSTFEIHEKMEAGSDHPDAERIAASFTSGDRPDPAARRRVLARLRDHRGRDGRARAR
jgi:predicted tellurium resistance membrane protein TerC